MPHKGVSHDKTIKNIATIFLSIILLTLILSVFSSGNGLSGHMGYSQNSTLGNDSFLISIISFALELLTILIIIALNFGLFGAVQNKHKE